MIKTVTEELDNLRPHLATRAARDFWLKDLSRGYIQIVRDRISVDDKEAIYVLTEIYVGLLKLLAPVIPFTTEKIWQELKEKKIVREESIHLSEWPKVEKKKIDEKLEGHFATAFQIIEVGLRMRDKEGIGLKWPLASAEIVYGGGLEEEIEKIISRQLNIKKLKTKKGKMVSVKLNTKITPELEAEGFSRELARKVQAERKKAGLKKGDLIKLKIGMDENMLGDLERFREFLKERTNSSKLEFVVGKVKGGEAFNIKKKEFSIVFS